MSNPGEYVLELTSRASQETENFFVESPESHKLSSAQGFAFGWLMGATDQYAKFARPIPVSERLPENCDRVLAYGTDILTEWGTADFIDGNFLFDIASDNDNAIPMAGVTHWLPMPPEPE